KSIPAGNKTARGEIEYPAYQKQRAWMEQFTTYRLLQRYPLWDSSTTLYAFKARAAESRYGLLADIENYLANGEYSKAQDLLDAYSLNERATTATDDVSGVVMADD